MTRIHVNRRKADFDSLWLLTFADLMVQLMVAFVVLNALNSQDKVKAQAIVESITKALGGKVDQGEAAAGAGILPGQSGLDPKDRAADLEKLLSDLKATDGPDEGHRLRIVSFRGSLLFDEGSTAPNPTFQPLLTRIAELVKEYPGFQLVCEGHAGPGERGRSADPLELSGQRAQGAVRALVSQGVDARLIAAEAHGDARPEGEAESAEGRALQRRVKFRFQRAAER